MTQLQILHAAPGLSLQDMGRNGLVSQGVSPGGAADRLALLEGAALLSLPAPLAALEMAGAGGVFTATAPLRIALTGAPMTATLEGQPLAWNASHLLPVGAELRIGGVRAGTYGYLSFSAPVLSAHLPTGTAVTPWQGSIATHFAAGIGARLTAGCQLEFGDAVQTDAPPLCLPTDTRFEGGLCRVMPGPQTDLFAAETCARFYDTRFTKGQRANRQGVALESTGQGFSTPAATGLLSDFIAAGDIQMTGDGQPFVLLSECQTIGGYPRLGTVLPEDLPRVAQCQPGATLQFQQVTLDMARDAMRCDSEILSALRQKLTPLTRAPQDIRDLLSYQLVSGVTAGDDLDIP